MPFLGETRREQRHLKPEQSNKSHGHYGLTSHHDGAATVEPSVQRRTYQTLLTWLLPLSSALRIHVLSDKVKAKLKKLQSTVTLYFNLSKTVLVCACCPCITLVTFSCQNGEVRDHRNPYVNLHQSYDLLYRLFISSYLLISL